MKKAKIVQENIPAFTKGSESEDELVEPKKMNSHERRIARRAEERRLRAMASGGIV